MAKFILGVVLGALMAIGYVRFELALPAVLQLPDKLRGNLVSAATESELYDLDRDPATRTRALEIFLANRSAEAARIDAAAGHPFLAALYRERAAREARQLAMEWTAYDEVLAKDGLRDALERRLGTTETDTMKRQLLIESLARKPFLKSWLEKNVGPATRETVRDVLRRAGAKQY